MKYLCVLSLFLLFISCNKKIENESVGDVKYSFKLDKSKLSKDRQFVFYGENLEDSIKLIFEKGAALSNVNKDNLAIYRDSLLLVASTDMTIKVKDLMKIVPDSDLTVYQQINFLFPTSNAGPVKCNCPPKVSCPSGMNISIFISPDISPDWVEAITAAINRWNLINNRFNFFIAGLDSKGFPIGKLWFGKYHDATTSVVAYANLPSGGNPGQYIHINSFYDYLSSDNKINCIMHEMGHTLGYRHTNESNGVTIPGSPTSDPLSIMHSFVQPVTTFSPWDVFSHEIVYPTLTGSITRCTY